MALEQDISRLVEASNQLTTAVDNKIKDIDKYLKSSSFAYLNKKLVQVFYIDAVEGDDESGDGSEKKPFKTIHRCQKNLISCSYTKIMLKAGQQHIVENTGLYQCLGYISINRWGSGISSSPIVKLVFNGDRKHHEDGKDYGYLFGMRQGVIGFYHVDLTIEYTGNNLSKYSSTIMYESGDVTTIFYRVKIILNGAPLLRVYSGTTKRDLYISRSSIEQQGDRKLIENNYSFPTTIRLDISNTTTGDKNWSDLVEQNQDKNNIFTNQLLN